jgi:hypothetical protein
MTLKALVSGFFFWLSAILCGVVFWVFVASFILGGCRVNAAEGDVTVIPWDVETTRPAVFPLELYRGETVILEPRFLNLSQPMDLSAVYEVRMRYRHAGMAEGTYYSASGSVHNATSGVIRVTWSPGNVPTGTVSSLSYNFITQSTNGVNPRAAGTIKLRGIVEGDATNRVPEITEVVDWSLVTEHLHPEAAPFAGPGDVLAINNRIDGHDAAISNVTDLVGDGVAGVTSNLQAYIVQAGQTNAAQDQALAVAAAGLTSNLQAQASGQVIRDAGQDVAIAAAAAGATMNGDVTGQSSNAVVVATRGRTLPLANDVPGNQQAIVWSTNLNRYVHGSVDLSGINSSIANLQSNAVSKSYVDTEISEVRGLVDGNDHTHQLTESFASSNWLEIASGVWQHNKGWMAYNANILDGNLILTADVGYILLSATQCVSRIVLTPSAGIWSAQYASNTTAATWFGYDATRDNIVATNMFGVKLRNTSGSSLTVGQVDFYTWTFPERVAFSRDFAGLHLLVDTPPGDQLREAVNVQYVRTLAATGDISGTFATGYRVDKIAQGIVNNTARANGYGLIWYQSVSEHRYVDMATQFELDAAVALRATQVDHLALAARVSAAEAGGVAISGDVTGSHLQTSTVARIRGKVIDTPTVNQTTPVYDLAQGKIVWQSVLSSNLVYSAGTNSIESVPANAAAFYRAMYGTNSIMPVVLDQQIVGWFGRDGLTIPMGTINILQSNLTANVRLYDGSAAQPALSTVSDPDTGWYRSAEDVWTYVAAGNLVADWGVAGLSMRSGKTITGLTGYATTGTVGAINTRLQSVEAWPTGTWSTAYSWGNHASAGYSTGTPWTLLGYIQAPAATSAAQAVIAPFTNDIFSAWQNPADATNWQWISDGLEITLTNYSGPANVVIPDMLDGVPVRSLGESLFSPGQAGSNITSVKGGDNIKSIGENAFCSCSILTNVTLQNVTSIGYNAFGGCIILPSVNFPNLTSLGDAAFDSCDALTVANLGQVTSIGTYAFEGCDVLTNVTFYGNNPSAGANIYASSPNVINYVTNPTATGWGSTFGGMPVVRLPADGDEIKIKGTVLLISGGTNLLWVASGVTNRVVLEAYP